MNRAVPRIAPSILSADFGRLAEAVMTMTASGADWIHIDVMDGHFVPNLTVGPPLVKALRNETTLPLDVHLMMTNPDVFIPEFAEAGADYLTVHVEACPHLHRTIQAIKEHHMKAGVTLNPGTSITTLEEIVEEVDLVLVMTVNPGFGGQTFISSGLEKINRVRRLIDHTTTKPLLEVDGGVTLENAGKIVRAGAEVLVSGSAIFSSKDYASTIYLMRSAGRTMAV